MSAPKTIWPPKSIGTVQADDFIPFLTNTLSGLTHLFPRNRPFPEHMVWRNAQQPTATSVRVRRQGFRLLSDRNDTTDAQLRNGASTPEGLLSQPSLPSTHVADHHRTSGTRLPVSPLRVPSCQVPVQTSIRPPHYHTTTPRANLRH